MRLNSHEGTDGEHLHVENQRERHQTQTFQEEYLTLLIRHEIEYDERYLWDRPPT